MKNIWSAVLAVFMIVSCVESQTPASDFPHPLRDVAACKTQKGVPLCDPHGYLEGHDLSLIRNYIEDLSTGDQFQRITCTDGTVRGIRVAVAVTDYLDSTSTVLSTKSSLSKKYADSIANSWRLGDVGCNNGIILLFAVEDRSMTISTTKSTRELLSDNSVMDILSELKPYLRDKNYGRAIEVALESMQQDLRSSTWWDYFISFLIYFGISLVIIWLLFRCYKSSNTGHSAQRVAEELDRLRNVPSSELHNRCELCPICLEGINGSSPEIVDEDEMLNKNKNQQTADFDDKIDKKGDNKSSSISPIPEGSLVNRIYEGNNKKNGEYTELKQQPTNESLLNDKNSEHNDEDAVALRCNHIFHRGCIEPWLQRNDSCPLCRARVIVQSDIPAPVAVGAATGATTYTNNNTTHPDTLLSNNNVEFAALTHLFAERFSTLHNEDFNRVWEAFSAANAASAVQAEFFSGANEGGYGGSGNDFGGGSSGGGGGSDTW